MDEAVLALLGTLVEVRTELGSEVYMAAVDRARLAIAAEVMVEAERRVLAKRTKALRRHDHEGGILLFPTPPRMMERSDAE
ncbi:hypothetical protein ASG63_14110 [Methylobacterium sp. Leaf94]|uniref:hypothetical protein n=1 Tax=Methylobacterium sp. Leaf94 TaxID=1736250 RepID=UPI0006F5E1DC|nr:hypothetical protein [Methylobacterium sp. Leaf94]KQU34157.1 hypothetical protein ASG63_14110 [Methylobacterium sp. Leaf94]